MTNTGTRTGIFCHKAFRLNGFNVFQNVSKKHLTVRSYSFMFFHMTEDYQNILPDPQEVAQAAAEAAAPRVLEDYTDAITILREKKFTFREIAEWLGKKFGIRADHNSVWRTYTKHMDNYDAHLEAEADEELERDEAMEEVERDGTLKTVPPAPAPVAEAASAEKTEMAASKIKLSRTKRAKKK